MSLLAREDPIEVRLVLRRFGRSSGSVSSRSSGVGRSHGGVSSRSSGIGSGSRSSGGIGRRGSGVGRRGSGVSGRSGNFRVLLGAASHQRESRDRGGESNVQFHVGVPQKYLVVSETKQTFVATICTAARDFIDSPIHLKQLQFCPLMATTCGARRRCSDARSRSNACAAQPERGFVAMHQCVAIVPRRIESRHEFTRY
jgi:hypothetical protein